MVPHRDTRKSTGGANHFIFFVILILLAVVVVVLFIIVVIFVERPVVVAGMERLVRRSHSVLGIFLALHAAFRQLLHHVDEMLPVVL